VTKLVVHREDCPALCENVCLKAGATREEMLKRMFWPVSPQPAQTAAVVWRRILGGGK